MYAMLRVVAIVVLVSTIAGAVKVKNFTERTYSSLKLIDANQKITAEVTNAEHETQFTIEDQPQPTDQEDHGTVFRNDLDFRRNNDASLRIKLNIEEEQVYYHPIYFGIVVKNNLKKCGPCIPIFKKKDLLILALLLKPSNQDAHITLEMPVFMVPEKVHDNGSLQKWAVKHRVGVITPILQNALETALQTGKLSLNFIWLKELLSYKIYLSKHPHDMYGEEIPTYVTRPLVVTEDTKNVIIQFINKSNAKPAN